jgi:hypothetical protein
MITGFGVDFNHFVSPANTSKNRFDQEVASGCPARAKGQPLNADGPFNLMAITVIEMH